MELTFEQKAEQIANTFYSLDKELFELIKTEVKNLGGFIDFDFTTIDDYYCFTIAYDGGKHPEYASTINSTVESISISNDDLKIETEDGDMYGLCSFDDMLTIVELIKLYKEQNNIK
jgi:hypothetical protein